MEAQAMQIPVIATDHSGLKEGIIDGKTGFLVPERDVTALADAMVALQADANVRARFGKAGRTFIQKEFNAQTQNDLLAAIVDSVQN
jgi:colanic acid/amylovoran biosynthesis glycosyltransferase